MIPRMYILFISLSIGNNASCISNLALFNTNKIIPIFVNVHYIAGENAQTQNVSRFMNLNLLNDSEEYDTKRSSDCI